MKFDKIRVEKGKEDIMFETLSNISEGYARIGNEDYYVFRLSADSDILKIFSQRERIMMALLAGGSCSFASIDWEKITIEGVRESVYRKMKEKMGKIDGKGKGENKYWKYTEEYLDAGLKPDDIVISIDKNKDLDDTGKIVVSFITGKIYEILHGPSIDQKNAKRLADVINKVRDGF